MLDDIREAARSGSYLVTEHLLKRLLERGIDLADLEWALSEQSEVIEDYPDHHISPCCLILCRGRTGKWYHVVSSGPPVVAWITVYEPDPGQWSEDLRRRLQ